MTCCTLYFLVEPCSCLWYQTCSVSLWWKSLNISNSILLRACSSHGNHWDVLYEWFTRQGLGVESTWLPIAALRFNEQLKTHRTSWKGCDTGVGNTTNNLSVLFSGIHILYLTWSLCYASWVELEETCQNNQIFSSWKARNPLRTTGGKDQSLAVGKTDNLYEWHVTQL